MKNRVDITILVLCMIIGFTRTLIHSAKSFHPHKYRGVSSAFSSLIMDIPVVIRGLKDIVNQYDVFLFDQFGVLHDGHTVFDEVKESLQYLKQQNKTLALVSNTSRRVSEAQAMLQQRGFEVGTFDLTFTSGELAWDYLVSKNMQSSSSFSPLSGSASVSTTIGSPTRFSKCCFLSFAHQTDTTELNSIGIECVDIEEADFVLLHGTQLLHTGSSTPTALDIYKTGHIDDNVQHILSMALSNHIPIICANSDMTAIAKNKLQYMPGLIANKYEAMGGVVKHFGKPHSIMFEAAIETSLNFHRCKQQHNSRSKQEVLSSQQIIEMIANDRKIEQESVLRLQTIPPSTTLEQQRQPLGSLIRQEMSTTVKAKLKQTLRRKERLRVLHVGDSLHHDILGK